MKKIAVFVLAFTATVFLVFGIVYAKKSGLLKAYPDAVYMNSEMADTRIAYQNLNESEKAVYTALYNGILQNLEYIDLPSEISGEEYEKIYFNIEKQEPELFCLSGDFYSAEKIRTAQIIYRDDLNMAIFEIDGSKTYYMSSSYNYFIIINADYFDKQWKKTEFDIQKILANIEDKHND